MKTETKPCSVASQDVHAFLLTPTLSSFQLYIFLKFIKKRSVFSWYVVANGDVILLQTIQKVFPKAWC